MENKNKILAILPVSIGGRLTTNSIIDGYRQNGCEVTVYDELFDDNLTEILAQNFDQIVGYDFSALKIKVDNGLSLPSINYFSDDIRRSREAGMNEHLSKPLEMEKIIRTAARYCGKR